MPESSNSPVKDRQPACWQLLSAACLLSLPAFLLMPGSAAAAGPGIAIAGEVRSAVAPVVEPVRMRRRAWAPRRAQSRGRHGQHADRGDHSSHPTRDTPSRDRPHRHTHRHGPHLPPLRYYPRTTEERAEYLASLPRRSQQAQQGQSQTVERQIVILFSTDRSLSLRNQVASTHGLEQLRGQALQLLNAQIGLFRIRGARSAAAVLAALQQDGRVRAAQLNQRYFHTQGTGRQVAIPQYGPLKVGLPEAHRLALGRKVTVAVIDSRVDTTHPDLKGAVVRAYDAAGGADNAPDFHGTAVAGIIRGRGIVEGVAPEAEILAVRAFRVGRQGTLPETDTFTLLGGIDWAVRNGARILNMSFTGARDTALQQALEAAGKKGVILVAAAGNAGPKAPPAFPAAYPGVIAVTAVDEADRRYVHANRGSYIAVAAPGVDILAPVERGGHSYLSGTSFAAAYVSGIAALLLERDPHLGATALAKAIEAGADDLGPVGRDDDFGAGRVNAVSSLVSMSSGLAAR